jgi:uncharacterized protein DUF4384
VRNIMHLVAITTLMRMPAVFSGPAVQESTRQIVAEEFLKARPPATKPKPTTARPPSKAAPHVAANEPAGTVQLGLTLWRLRPAAPTDDGARLLVQDSSIGLTAERVDLGTPLAIGDRVRLTVESPSAGYLYVVDREVYQDRTTGDPYLIFPTARTRQGDNSVRAGRLVDIPDQSDRPNYFSVRPSRPGQIGELLTFIISPSPLDKIAVSTQPLKLPVGTVAAWTKSWSAPVQQFVQDGGARLWTQQEQAAAADASRLLTQDDPPPQTIFRVAAKKGAPVLVDVQLPYAASDR